MNIRRKGHTRLLAVNVGTPPLSLFNVRDANLRLAKLSMAARCHRGALFRRQPSGPWDFGETWFRSYQQLPCRDAKCAISR